MKRLSIKNKKDDMISFKDNEEISDVYPDVRVKTGIKGLDEILKGGIRKASSILVTGSPGSGKTIFALQFLYEGAKRGEPGLYITCEDTIEDIETYAKSLGLNMEDFESKDLITFIKQPITTRKLMTISAPLEIIKEKKIKRVVLDSLTFFEYTHAAGEMDFRKEVLEFIWVMKESGVSLVVTSENPESEMHRYKAEDFLFEGLINLMMIRRGSSFERCIRVIKMRGQKHLIDIYPFQIKGGGIEIFPEQIPFSLIGGDERDVKLK